MQDKKRSKLFPKRFNDETYIDEDGYPYYKRMDNCATVVKGNIELDNRYVFLYNPSLLRKYRAHINVEWFNQSRAIKYLFMYSKKGQDRITAGWCRNKQDVDEIQEYFNY